MKKRIYFVHSHRETFVQMDRELLRQSFTVDDYLANRPLPFSIMRIWRGVRENDCIYCWFASRSSFWTLLFARMMKKKSVLVIGGYDVANIPEAGYGSQRGGFRKWISRQAMQMATVITTFSYFSQKEANINADLPLDRVSVIYLGVPDPFHSLPPLAKKKLILTVGNVNQPNLLRKGLENFVRAAREMPQYRFVLVGAWQDQSIRHLKEIASENVILTGRVDEKILLEYYRKASVYVQASLHEGFGLSVAEAMLGGCIPVVTRVGSLPEVVGDCGIYIETPALENLVPAIAAAINIKERNRKKGRERIMTDFTLETRRRKLEQIINLL
jgi:glycosyltransferase involved in cell wall biosynthesis